MWIVSISVALAGIMLAYTSYLDLKKREVEDRIWVIFGACGVILQIYAIYSGATVPLILGISVGLASVIGLGIFFLGLYGGADAKALIVLAVVLPYFQPRVGLYAIAPVIILTNGILLSMFLPGGLFLLNVTRLVRSQPIFEGFREPAYRKILACLLGYKSAGKPRGFQFSMERNVVQEQSNPSLSNSLTKKFDFTFMQDEFETKPGTWVTPGIPLLVFFAAGFIALLAYGDLVIGLVQFLAGML